MFEQNNIGSVSSLFQKFTSIYRYGFNGKEKEDDVAGAGNTYDYGFRIYNTQLGRFLSIDPITKDYPMLTPYQFTSNSPIAGSDLDGLEFFYAADGTFIGNVGASTKVMVINDNVTLEQAQKAVDDANNNKVSSEDFASVSNTYASDLTFRGKNVSNFEFTEYCAIIYNETRGANEEGKQEIADGIYNKKDALVKDYPALKEPNLQQCLDKVAYSRDSQDQRMSAKRANPGKGDIIPGSKSKKYPNGIPLSNIRAKNYQTFFNKDAKERNKNPDMKLTIKTVINSLKRDNGKRTEDMAKGKSHWIGNGKTHKMY